MPLTELPADHDETIALWREIETHEFFHTYVTDRVRRSMARAREINDLLTKERAHSEKLERSLAKIQNALKGEPE